MKRRAAWVWVAATATAAGCVTTNQQGAGPEPESPFDAVVLATAGEVLRLGASCGLGGRFAQASLKGGTGAGTWQVVVDDRLPSPLDGPAACSRGSSPALTTVCHRDGDRTVCSRRALTALARHDEAAAGGGVPVTLLHVLAHELTHIVQDHDAAAPTSFAAAPRSDEEKLAQIRGRVDQAGPQLQMEEQADRAAACVVAATIPSEGDARRTEAILRVQLALRSTFAELDERTRCLFDDQLTLPASPQEIEAGARRVLCAAMRSSPFAAPLLRGSHPDWGGRMATLSFALPKRPKAAPSSDPRGPIFDLIGGVNDVFEFMEARTDAHHRALATAVRNATFEYDAARCDLPDETPACAPLELPKPAATTGSVRWSTLAATPGAATLGGKVVALDVRGTTVAVALEQPDRVAVWEPFQSRLSVAEVPCHPHWASVDGSAILVACGQPGAVMTIDGDRSTLTPVGPAKRADDPGLAPVSVRWVGAVNGKRLLSARYEAGGGFVVDWTNGRFAEIGAATAKNCIPFLGLSPYRLEAHPLTGSMLAIPLHNPAMMYVLGQDGARQTGELGSGAWQEWALEHDQPASPAHVCRASHLGKKGVRCILDDLQWIDPEREPEKQIDGRVAPPEKLTGTLDQADFCDTRRARFALTASRDELIAFEVTVSGSRPSIARQPGEGTVVGCGEDMFAVGFSDSKGAQLRAFQ